MGIGETAPLAAQRAAVGQVDLDVDRRRREPGRLDFVQPVHVAEKLLTRSDERHANLPMRNRSHSTKPRAPRTHSPAIGTIRCQSFSWPPTIRTPRKPITHADGKPRGDGYQRHSDSPECILTPSPAKARVSSCRRRFQHVAAHPDVAALVVIPARFRRHAPLVVGPPEASLYGYASTFRG